MKINELNGIAIGEYVIRTGPKRDVGRLGKVTEINFGTRRYRVLWFHKNGIADKRTWITETAVRKLSSTDTAAMLVAQKTAFPPTQEEAKARMTEPTVGWSKPLGTDDQEGGL